MLTSKQLKQIRPLIIGFFFWLGVVNAFSFRWQVRLDNDSHDRESDRGSDTASKPSASTAASPTVGPVIDVGRRAIASSSIPSSVSILPPSISIHPEIDAEYPHFAHLQQRLEQAGFIIELAIPPIPGNYGLLDRSNRTIWINPAVFELGSAQHVLVHEAVHAAQLCASPNELLPLALDLEPPHIVKPYFMRYSGIRRQVEAEAYTVQALDNSMDYVMDLLNQHCTDE